MQSTMMRYEEDLADAQLITKTSGVWTLLLYSIDSMAHCVSAGAEKEVG